MSPQDDEMIRNGAQNTDLLSIYLSVSYNTRQMHVTTKLRRFIDVNYILILE